MPYAIEGLEQTLKGLRKFSPELYKEMNTEIKPELKSLTIKAKDKFQSTIKGLRNFGTYTNKSGKEPIRKFPIYNVEDARRGITFSIGSQKRNNRGWTNRYVIWNKSRAGAIVETAGRKNPSGREGVTHSAYFDKQIESMAHLKAVGRGRKQQGRIIFAAVNEDQGKVKRAIEQAIVKAVNKFNKGQII